MPKNRDHDLFRAYKKLPSFPFFKLVRPSVAQMQSQRLAFQKTGTAPTLSFPDASRFDIVTYQKAVKHFAKQIHSLTDDTTVARLYKDKADELLHRAELIRGIQKQDGQLVAQKSIELFGTQKQTLKQFEEELSLLASPKSKARSSNLVITSSSLTRAIRKILAHYSIDTWLTGFHDRTSIRISRSNRGFTKIVIPKQIRITADRAVRVLGHEIEGHVLRHFNSEQSDISLVKVGLANYISAEEGLAMFIQQKYGKKWKTPTPGFWDGYMAALRKKYDFKEAYDRIREARLQVAEARKEKNPEKKADDAAWRLSIRAQRGIARADAPGLFYGRDHIYRTGLDETEKFLQKHSDGWKRLYAGHTSFREAIKLPDRDDIVTPEFICEDVVKQILKTDAL